VTPDQVARRFTAADVSFDAMAHAVLDYQRAHNAVYGRYCEAYDGRPDSYGPYLPVEAFKRAAVTAFPPEEAEHIFRSSGTGHGARSRHYIRRLHIYEQSIAVNFERVFGSGPFLILAHLPHYVNAGEESSLL
jgi:hypothetical protein